MKIERRKLLRYIRIITYIILIMALILLKYTNLIQGQCYINNHFGILCPTCGITRAVRAVVNLDILLAIQNNAYATLILLPIFIILFIDDIICIVLKKKSLVEIILGE